MSVMLFRQYLYGHAVATFAIRLNSTGFLRSCPAGKEWILQPCVSTENGKWRSNQGLNDHDQGLGGRGLLHEFYEWML